MTRPHRSLLFVAGLLVGLAASAFAPGALRPRAASARNTPRADNDGFAIATWTLPFTPQSGGSPAVPPAYGAYLLDTARGNVYLIKGDGKPAYIGSPGQ